MISPFRVDDCPRPPREAAVIDLMKRVRCDVGGIRFVSLDEPVEAEPVDTREEVADLEAFRVAAAAEELRARVEAARTEASVEARRGFEMELETRLVEERRRMDQVRLEFARDRQRFFAAAESQVVKLALAVARKILHRDAQAEGLTLRATVKAALAKVQDGSSTVLRVPEHEVEAWRAMFLHGTAGKVEVIGEKEMAAGECVLVTNLGKVELGLEVQMEEVERGFGELMQEQGY